MIQFRSVSKRFGNVVALESVSFEVPVGENTALLGPSGCGKSTALRLLAGLETLDGGQIRVGGRTVSEPGQNRVPPQERGVSMVFQDLALWPGMTTLQNVVFACRDPQRARDALSLCLIDPLADRRPHLLSGGQQQRVALARALSVSPPYLLLDEPFSGLDLITKMQLLDEIRKLARARGTTVVLVTHDPLEASALCEQAVVLEGGRVIEAGAYRSLLASPKSRTLQVFREHVVS